jgi:excisionase family DNA binding protein
MTSLISTHGTAMRLQLTDAEVARMVKRGEIPHVVLPGGRVRFEPMQLATWIKSLTRPQMEITDASRA